MPDRDRYSEEEVRAILKRAAERQHRADLSVEARATGLSPRELEQVAAAAGIDAQHVRAATLEVERNGTAPATASPLDGLVGAPTQVELERVLPGHLDEALWQKLVVELRKTFGMPGTAEQLGTIREWRSNANPQDHAEIQAEEIDGVVHLSLRRSWVNHAVGPTIAATFAGGFGLFLFLIGMLADKLAKVTPIAAAVLILGLVTFAGVRVVYPRWSRGQTERFSGLMDRLERIVADYAPVGDPIPRTSEAAVEAVASTEPVLSLDERTDEDEVPTQTSARSRQRG
ncbi:MAG: hypothetical protein AAF624_14580 [Bacteroidota bacterium]